MNSRFLTVLASSTLAIVLAGCATTYRGPSSYVDYSTDGKAKSTTQSANVGTSPKLKSTYDDEFVYDATGNIVKHKQTEYFNYDKEQPSFVVWETDFKVVGGVVLPYRQSVNDVTYVEIDYDVLTSQAKGPIKQGTYDRRFSVEKQQGFDKLYFDWNPELDRFPVDFKADSKYVVTQRTWYPNRGFEDENVLTLGYDNIVLKHYKYSYSSLVEGFNKSFQWGLFNWNNGNYSRVNSEFNYDWKVIGTSIVQTDFTFSREGEGEKMNFEAKSAYNDAGQRTDEVWTAQENADKPVTVFHQTLQY